MLVAKRKVLSIQEKFEIIKEVENATRVCDVCRKYGLSNSTVQTILKQKIKIKEAYNQSKTKSKRLRKAEHPNLDKALFEWFKQQRSLNRCINGPLLQTKCEDMAQLLGYENFVCSSSWIDRFKIRHGICYGKIHGEAKDADLNSTKDWLTTVWPSIKIGYSDDDIFNADETGLFYKLTPDGTLKFKGEKCVGGKHSKERITVLICANMSGNEKRKLTVIGKATNPRCFKNIKHFPNVTYRSNKKAWMTATLFEEILVQWDQQLIKQKRQILLILDNCTAHPKFDNLVNIKLVFLPPNTTSVLQPMDQGVIRSFKAHYRKLMLHTILKAGDNNECLNISLLDGIKFAEKAWNRVTSTTIKNCFQHSGLTTDNTEMNTDDDIDDMPLSQLAKLLKVIKLNFDLDSYIDVDKDVITNEILSDEDIVNDIIQIATNNEVQDEKETEDNSLPVPSLKEAVNALHIVEKYFESSNGDNANILSNISYISDVLENKHWASLLQQSKITDFKKNSNLLLFKLILYCIHNDVYYN